MSYLSREISTIDSYKLSKLNEGDIIPIVSDVMFETMFNNTKRKKYVSYLLSLILNEDYNELLNGIVFVKGTMDKNNVYDSKKTVDLICEYKNVFYNIEMNNSKTDRYRLERNISYLNKIYDGFMKRGKKKYIYNNVVQININNFNFVGNEESIDKFYLENSKSKKLTEKITFINIYLPIIKKKYYNKSELTKLEKYMIILNEKKSKDLEEIIKEDLVMKEYRRDAEEVSKDYEGLGMYDKELEDEILMEARMEDSKEIGKKEGVVEGEKRGVQKERLNIVKKLIDMNMKIEDISNITNLSIRQINELK